MKRKYVLVVISVLSFFLCVFILYNALSSKESIYSHVIHETFSRDFDAMSLLINETSSLDYKNAENYDVLTGSKKDDFNIRNNDGLKLWATQQLFQSLDEIDTFTEKFDIKDSEYFMIHLILEYSGKTKNNDINELYMFVNKENYHIIIPKYYIEPNMIDKVTTTYIEYEPNAITTSLINDILGL